MFFNFFIACEKGYIGRYCEIKCPSPFYGFHCQMICNCIAKHCDPVNGCKLSTAGMQMFLDVYSTLFVPLYKRMYSFVSIIFFKESNNSSLGLDWNSKMVTTDLLESEDGVSKSKIDFRSIQCTYN